MKTHKSMYWLVAIATALSVLIAACGGAATTAAPVATSAPAQVSSADLIKQGNVVVEAGQTVHIGQSTGLTGPIPNAGKDIQYGAQVAIDDLNTAGGVQSFKFELFTEDGGCDGDAGTTVGNKFAADPTITAVSGGMCSGETFGLTGPLKKARIPFVSPSATNAKVVSPECDICNRVVLNDALQSTTDADYIYNTLGFRKIAVLNDNSDYGLGLALVVSDAFVALGGTVTAFEGVQVGDTDFRAVLTKIAVDKPQAIFYGGFATEAALITQQKNEVGMSDVVFFGPDGAYVQQYLDAAGAAAEGAYASTMAGGATEATLADFTAKYVAKAGVKPDEMGPYHSQAYDSVTLIATAIKQVAKVDSSGRLIINREELIKAVRATKGLVGLTGTLTCDPLGECGAGGAQIFTVKDGKFVQVAGFGLK